LLLSVGAGDNLRFVDAKSENWGVIPWLTKVNAVRLVSDGMVGIADYQCQQWLGDSNYRRLAPAFPADVDVSLDDLQDIDFMTQFVDSAPVAEEIERTAQWLRDNWMPGIPASPTGPEVTSKHVGMATELTCLMPIRAGFVPIMDTRTYATRLRLLFRVFQTLRVTAREIRSRRAVPDIVDLARTVHAFSWSILGERQLLLNVTFDRPWEPYIRVIWKDLGPLMDLILCNCEGFVPSSEGFDAFARYVRQHQVDAGFFYPASSLTVDDEKYLVEFERRQRREGSGFMRDVTALAADDPIAEARAARRSARANEARDQWLAVLGALYGLRSLYPDGTKDQELLHAAARRFLQSSEPKTKLPDTAEVNWYHNGAGPTAGTDNLTARPGTSARRSRNGGNGSHAIEDGSGSGNGNGRKPDGPGRPGSTEASSSPDGSTPADRQLEHRHIQGGICKPYNRVSHGCLLLAVVEDRKKARAYLAKLASEITSQYADEQPRADDDPHDRLNVAITFNGLRRLGVNESELDRFPKEFREGMEARAGLLGDVRENHPENWVHPEWNVHYRQARKPDDVYFTGELLGQKKASTGRVRVSAIDVVLTIHHRNRVESADWQAKLLQTSLANHCRDAYANGLRIVAIEPLRRLTRPRPGLAAETPARTAAAVDASSAALTSATEGAPPSDGVANAAGKPPRFEGHDHFGFADGLSQPSVLSDTPGRDRVAYGELFVGFRNDRDDPDFPEEGESPSGWSRGSLIDSGTFLVIRKLSQDVEAFDEVINEACATTRLSRNDVMAQLVGRDSKGVPRIKKTKDPRDNDFGFHDDRRGQVCPFHAHIRRGNPRLSAKSDSRVPRLFRAGLAYGQRIEENPESECDRGMMFMAYNASLAEQFEVIQRWMMAGNPPRPDGRVSVYSGQPDPLLGLPDGRGPRTFRIEGQNAPQPISLGDTPLVTLRWGVYLFVPSIPALEAFKEDVPLDTAGGEALASLGANVIHQLTTQDSWAAALEDVSAIQSGVTRSIFAAIKLIHGGVIRTPYGILVTDKKLAHEVMHGDPVYSVREYQRRFATSIGRNYLGLDDGPAYRSESTKPNRILMAISEDDAFDIANKTAQRVLEDEIAHLRSGRYESVSETPRAESTVTLALDAVVGRVLALLATHWFDIPDGKAVVEGLAPQSNDDERVLCPYHFIAPSRFVFSSPNPRDQVRLLGNKFGQELQEAIRKFVETRQSNDGAYQGRIIRELRRAIPDDDVFKRELGGLVFGFVPPTYGSALQLLLAWLTDESFWHVQQRFLSAREMDFAVGEQTLKADLERAMQEHPVPPLVHRTVTEETKLGNVSVIPGDRVVLCMPAIANDDLSNSRSDVSTVFGGNREQPGHPTHACPGIHIAMGVLRGILSALFSLDYELSPSPTPLTIRVRVGSRRSSVANAAAAPPPVGGANE
jgi:Dyp-type peroxidase family